MGGNMAARILAAGYPVYGEERSREHAQHLIDEGLQWCDTPREVAEAADVVFTSVPDDGVREDIASGPNGVLAGLAAGKTWVDVSTVSPQASRELAARVRTQGTFMLDAPSREASRKGFDPGTLHSSQARSSSGSRSQESPRSLCDHVEAAPNSEAHTA